MADRVAAGFARLVTAINAVDSKTGGWSATIKSADEARNNSSGGSTLTADAVLRRTLPPGQHHVRMRVAFLTANATMDLKYDTAFSGGSATVRWHRHRRIVAGAAAGTDNETTSIGTGQVPSTAATGTTSGAASVEVDMIIDVASQGELQFRWAQNTADAGLLTCLRGSYLEVAAC